MYLVTSSDSSDLFSHMHWWQLLFIDGDELVERPVQVMDSVQKFLKIPQVNYLKLLQLVQSVLNAMFVVELGLYTFMYVCTIVASLDNYEQHFKYCIYSAFFDFLIDSTVVLSWTK